MKNWKNSINYIAVLFTGVIIIILICYLFVGIGLKFDFDDGFFTRFGINMAIMLAIVSIWYPLTKQKEEQNNAEYIKCSTKKKLINKQITDTSNFAGLEKFCENATKTNEIDAIKEKLISKGIDYTVYLAYKEQIKKDGINIVDEDKNLNKWQKKALKRILIYGATHRFLFWRIKSYRVIRANRLMTGLSSLKSRYDDTNEEKRYDTFTIVSKIITSVLLTFGIALIVFDGKGFNLAKLAEIALWLGMISWNIFTSIIYAKKSVSIHKVNYTKKIINILEEFIHSNYYNNTIEWQEPIIVKEEGNK